MQKIINVTLLIMILLAIPLTLMAKTFMYVPSGPANDIVIIDLSTDEISGRIDELENAHGLSSSPHSEYLVAGSMSQTVLDKLDQTSRPKAVSETEHKEHHSGEASKSKEATEASFVSIVHPQHGHVVRRINVGTITHHTAISPDGKAAIAVHSTAGGISVINLENFQVTNTVQTGDFPNYAIFSADGKRLYISNAQSATISEINTKEWAVMRTLKVGREPEHMAISPDSSKLYVANVGDGTATVVDLLQGAVTKTYETGKNPHGIDLSDDGRWLFVSSMGEGKVSKIDLANDEIKSVDIQPAPYHLDYVGKVDKLYVSSRKEPKIWVFDPQKLTLLKTIDIGKGVAHQMVTRDE